MAEGMDEEVLKRSLTSPDVSAKSGDFALHIRSPNITNRKTVRIWIAGIDDKLIDASDPCRAAEGGDDRFVRTDLCLFNEPTCEERSQDSFMHEILIQPKLTACIKCCHLGAGAGAAGGAVDHTCPRGWFAPIEFAC